MSDMRPDLNTDTAMRELHKFVMSWVDKHELSEREEVFYLAEYLAGRLHVVVLMEACKSWKEEGGDDADLG